MTPDRLEKMLGELPAPASSEARERAVAAARAEVAGREGPAPASRNGTRRALTVALAAVVLAIVLVTPPGRSASAWVGELVGIGEVGGSATLKEGGFKSSRGVVIANGRAPDGTRYEWVVYDCKVDLRDEGMATHFEGFGMALEWPDAKGREGSGGCEEAEGAPARDYDLGDMHVQILPSQFKGVAEPDLSVSGSTGPRVHRVRVVYTDTTGAEHDLDVDFERVPEELRERVGRNAPAGTFMAFIPGEWAARDDVEARLDLRALMGTGELELGEFAREERRRAREAMRACDRYAPDPWSDPLPKNPDPETVERIMRPLEECMDERMPPSPVTIIVYDDEGRELERWEEPLMLPPRPAAETLPPEPIPWDGPPRQSGGERVVLARGRAPEGARYEWFVEGTVDEGERIGSCVTMWWPRYKQLMSHASCGPGLPPSTAYGRREPEEVMAKPYGFLDAEVPATEHFMVSGYARPQVERVRVVWDGGRQEGPVELFPVSPEKAERMGATEPFGYWVGFVPRSARHAEFEIVAYGEGGGEIGRYRWRSDVTN
jgi:hypothetical protein